MKLNHHRFNFTAAGIYFQLKRIEHVLVCKPGYLCMPKGRNNVLEIASLYINSVCMKTDKIEIWRGQRT